MKRVGFIVAGALLLAAGASAAAPGKGGDKQQPVGAAARAKHGPDPLAAPPRDAGSAEDPVSLNPAVPPAPPKPDTPRR